MAEHKTEFFQKTRYASISIEFVDRDLPTIKIKQQFGSNGICNIDKVAQFWDRVSYKNEKIAPRSNRIQVAVNSNDISIRLLHPYCPVWSRNDHLSFYEEDEENGDFKKTLYQNHSKVMWLPHAGSTCGLTQKGEIFVYPKKVKVTYKIKEKNGEFRNSVKEVQMVKVEKELDIQSKKEEDVISQVSFDTEVMNKSNVVASNTSSIIVV